MQHWSQLATRNWRAKPVRTLGALFAIALGTGAVVWVTCCYESVRVNTLSWSNNYVGKSNINIESAFGKYDNLPERIVETIRGLSEVKDVTTRLVQRLRAEPIHKNDASTQPGQPRRWTERTPEIDFVGVDLKNESKFRTYIINAGRMLNDDDKFACVLEENYAKEEGIGLGDFIRVWTVTEDQPYELEIVGLTARRRIARFQKGLSVVRLPALQEMTIKQGLITSVDILLNDSTQAGVSSAASRIRPLVRKFSTNANVTSAESRMKQIDKAQDQLELVLTLLSCVAMLTALFIILSTLSMGMIERISQLGLMRCVGVTGSQLAYLMAVEVMPLGALGVLAGVPIGLGLTLITVFSVPNYVGSFAISWSGMLLAIIAGLVTTMLAAGLPAIGSLSVSPLEASRPRARSPNAWLAIACAVLAIFVLGAQQILMAGLPDRLQESGAQFAEWVNSWSGFDLASYLGGVQRAPSFLSRASLAVVLLYLGYALLGPLTVKIVGLPIVAAASALTGVRMKLLQNQIGHAVWRSAGICCGMMVGLSLIVGLLVFSESIKSGWEFPKEFPEAYVWNFEQMRGDAARILQGIPMIKEFSAANAQNVIVEERDQQRPIFMEKVLLSVTWFLGCEPDSFFKIMKLDFLEGDRNEALAEMKKGGNVLIAKDFAITRQKKLGDTVRVYLPGQSRANEFKVVGVIDSPSLDVAATYFQAHSEMHVAAVGSVLGTNADMERLWAISGTKLVLINFDTPPPVPGADWPPPAGTPEARELPRIVYDDSVSRERRWQAFLEERALHEVKQRLGAPGAFSGTVGELKDDINRELNNMTRLLTAVPAIAMIVAAIGVANLMTANVTSRARQLAILRAVGATRGLVLRMVVAEALVLGLLGSAMGLVLGMHLAQNTTLLTERMWGLQVQMEIPWGFVIAAVAMATGLSVLAGIVPARHAARADVVGALHTA